MQFFSVLMSVYKNEKLCNLQKAVESILNQTVLPNEIVIVKDGPLNEDIKIYLEELSVKYNFIKLINFSKNVGLGLALKAGVLACSNELIARMDTDDIAKYDRFEKQIKFLNSNPHISLLGGAIEEFKVNEKEIMSRTILPLEHEEIKNFAKRRNPFRHMTVIFKKTAVIESGNYRDFLWFEDYDLWIRMMHKGYKVANLSDILVSVRADDNMFARRGGLKYLRQDIKFQKQLLNLNIINYKQFLMNFTIRSIIRCCPNIVRIKFYKVFLRGKVK